VNSSVGLESMWFDKPVIACGQCFWALEGVAHSTPDAGALVAFLQAPDQLQFNPQARAALLSYLEAVYYPHYPAKDADIAARNIDKIAAQLLRKP
jgi:capsular polysaccharide export protein